MKYKCYVFCLFHRLERQNVIFLCWLVTLLVYGPIFSKMYAQFGLNIMLIHFYGMGTVSS